MCYVKYLDWKQRQNEHRAGCEKSDGEESDNEESDGDSVRISDLPRTGHQGEAGFRSQWATSRTESLAADIAHQYDAGRQASADPLSRDQADNLEFACSCWMEEYFVEHDDTRLDSKLAFSDRRYEYELGPVCSADLKHQLRFGRATLSWLRCPCEAARESRRAARATAQAARVAACPPQPPQPSLRESRQALQQHVVNCLARLLDETKPELIPQLLDGRRWGEPRDVQEAVKLLSNAEVSAAVIEWQRASGPPSERKPKRGRTVDDGEDSDDFACMEY